MTEIQPEIQLISNLVVTNEEGQVLFIKYDPEDEKWWLPGDDLKPYQHPDERAKEVLDAIEGLTWSDMKLILVESFRGRRGWHVMFDYHIIANGTLKEDSAAAWFSQDQLPRTKHGNWELETIRQVLDPNREQLAAQQP
jgi:hypothetical protein